MGKLCFSAPNHIHSHTLYTHFPWTDLHRCKIKIIDIYFGSYPPNLQKEIRLSVLRVHVLNIYAWICSKNKTLSKAANEPVLSFQLYRSVSGSEVSLIVSKCFKKKKKSLFTFFGGRSKMSSCSTWGNWGTVSIGDLWQDTQKIRGGSGIKTEIKWLTGGMHIYVCANR